MVRRAVNRAPSPNDRWWKDHAASCSGKFVKIKEPEGYSNKKNSGKAIVKVSGNITTVKGSKDNVAASKGSGNIADYMIKQDKSTSKRKKIVNGHIVLCEDDKTSKESSDFQVQTVRKSSTVRQSSDYESMRSKLLTAVEKRQQLKKGKMKRPNSISQEHSTTSKKRKEARVDDNDVVLIDVADDDAGPSSAQVSSVTNSTCTPPVLIIDEEPPEPPVHLPFTDNTTCPVCLREDIPRQILSSHVEFCLEEMELDELEIIGN